MNEKHKTLYIPLHGKAAVSKKGLILNDPATEKISEQEQVQGKPGSKLANYAMVMRARIFDEWTDRMLRANPEAIVLHIGCGLDSRCLRIAMRCPLWIDADLPDVIELRKKYYTENKNYKMLAFDAAKPGELSGFPEAKCAIVVMEGLAMYLKNAEIKAFFKAVSTRYEHVRLLMDAYTVFGAGTSRLRKAIKATGVTKVHGFDSIDALVKKTGLKCTGELSLTPRKLVGELPGTDRALFKLLYTGALQRKRYKLYELEERQTSLL